MDFRKSLRRANGLVERFTGNLASIAPLATRVVIGLAFLQAGTGKFRNFESVIGFFDSLGIPFPAFNAGLVASMETVGGVMLIFGLFTRFFAAGLTTTMMVALVTADKAAFLTSWRSAAEGSPTDVTAFVFLLFLLWLVFYGAGKISVDALLRRLLCLEPTSVSAPNPDSA